MRETADLLNDRRRPGTAVAPAGHVFKAFDHVKREEREFTVAAACGGRRGRWYCIEHALPLDYQRSMIEHTEQVSDRGLKKCLLVFCCADHGGRPETISAGRRVGTAVLRKVISEASQ